MLLCVVTQAIFYDKWQQQQEKSVFDASRSILNYNSHSSISKLEEFTLKKLLVLTVFYCTICTSLATAEPLIVAIGGIEEDTDSFSIAQSIASGIALRTGTEITLIAIPAKRASEYLLSGEIDGDLSRFEGFTQEISWLVKVSEPIANFPYYAYSTNRDIKIKGWNSLKAYKVAYVEDHLIIKAKLGPDAKNLFSFTSTEAALNFVASGRADVFVQIPFAVEPLLKKDNMKNKGIRALLPAVDFLPIYLHLLPKHAELAKKISFELKAMKKDQSYFKIMSGIF
ncbi:MAG: polar amino acid transport system substrate-binding protein [Oceanicoccus sp.]|jgi:polar amino acid transport system substrate-binding protein